MDKKIIGNRLKSQRKLLNMTREQFSEKIEISPQFLAEIENGTKGMSAKTLYKICTQFKISANFLLLGKEHYVSEATDLATLLSDIPEKYLPLVNEYILLLKKTIHT